MSKGDSQHDTAVGVGSIAGGVALALLAAVNPVAALAGIALLRRSLPETERGDAVIDPEFDRMARVVSLWAFVAAVVGGIALGIWSVLELFVFFDGNFKR